MPFCPSCGSLRPPTLEQPCAHCKSTDAPKEATLEELQVREELPLEERRWTEHRLRQLDKQKVWEVPDRPRVPRRP